MSASESLSISLGLGIAIPPPIRDQFSCEIEEAKDYAVNWRSPFRPTYQCVIDQDLQPSCVRRGTYGGSPGGFAMSAVTTTLAPRAVQMYPSCSKCMEACTYKSNDIGRSLGM
jgi:hypothetical protein